MVEVGHNEDAAVVSGDVRAIAVIAPVGQDHKETYCTQSDLKPYYHYNSPTGHHLWEVALHPKELFRSFLISASIHLLVEV